MDIPSQLDIKDIFNYLLNGFLVITSCMLFVSINEIPIPSNIPLSNETQIVLLISLSYVIGATLRNTLPPILKVMIGLNNKKFILLVYKLIGIKKIDQDYRLLFSETQLSLNCKIQIKKRFDLEYDQLNTEQKKEIFYIVIRFLESTNCSRRIDRLHFIANFHSRVLLVAIFALLLSITTIAIQLFKTNYNVLYYLPILIIIFVFVRYTSKILTKTIVEWWKNVWRSFLSKQNDA